MRLHYLQHVWFEDLANTGIWARNRGHSISGTLLPHTEDFPPIGDFDRLIILGGPMSTSEEEKYPWLVREKKFIAEAIANDKIVLGTCLGAQLIADALGAKLYKNRYKEIGWSPVSLTREARGWPIFNVARTLYSLPPAWAIPSIYPRGPDRELR